MPVNTIQIQKLLGKHTFQQLRLTINELIDVVNGLPSTVRGDITRQGGVIDGNSSGVIPTIDPGLLYIVGNSRLGVGTFLGQSDPTLTGHIHVNSTTNSRINLSQNAATGYSYISFQASNTASYPQANNFGFLSVTSNTTSRFGMITLGTANTDYEIDHIYASESWGWGNADDVSSATRFTLTSGENVGIAPHGGPTAHLAAQLRIDRAVNHDPQTSNTAPLLSVRGYTDAYGGVGVNDTPPVRILIGDRTLTAARKANTYAALDFAANGAVTTTEDSVGARISAEINREDDANLARSVSSSLEFSVRSGAGILQKVMKVLPGGDITGTDSQGAVLISNTHYLDLSTFRGAAADGAILDGNMQWSQLLVQHTYQTGSNYGGLMVRGDDTPGGGTSWSRPVIKMENPTAQYSSGRKWYMDVTDQSSSESRFRLANLKTDVWTGTPSIEFQVAVKDSATFFSIGNSNISPNVSSLGRLNGAVLVLDGGTNGEGAEIELNSNKASYDAATGTRPTSWIIDNNASTHLRFRPYNVGGYDGTTTTSYAQSSIVFNKNAGANTLIGIGAITPNQTLQIFRNYESANLHVESTFGSASPRNDSTARVVATGGGNDWAVVQAVNPNRTYTGRAAGRNYSAGLASGISFIAHQTNQPVSIKTTTSKEWSSAISPGANIIQLGVDITNDQGVDNLGYTYPMVSIAAEAGYGDNDAGRAVYFGTDNAGRSTFGGLRFSLYNAELGDNRNQDVFRLTAHGFLGIGTPAKASSKTVRSPTAVINPGFQLDLSGHRILNDNTANTLIAFSLHTDAWNTDTRLWTMGIDNEFTGIGKTDIPFVLGGKSSRNLGAIRGIHNNIDLVKDGVFSAEMRSDANRTQIYQIGIRPEHNTLTVYTPANTTSTGWSGGYAGRVGIGNTFPRYTLTVNGYNADSSGVAVYGAEAAIRLIDNAPLLVKAGESPLSETDADGSNIAERTYRIGARDGVFNIAQNLGAADTNIHSSFKNITVSIFANTHITEPVASVADGNIYLGEGLGSDWFSGGSVGINSGGNTLAAGLFVGDVPYGNMNKRGQFGARQYDPDESLKTKILPGYYPTQVIFGGRPLSAADGSFKPISMIGGNVFNGTGQGQVGAGSVVKRTEGIRRFSEGNQEWYGTSWHDGISVNASYTVPMPGIGTGKFSATDDPITAADPSGAPAIYANQATRAWWERRYHAGATGGFDNQEYSESHLFGSGNRHVMTIHANTSYQGVHVEKGGIYANNSVIAWARLRPRGDVDALVATETLVTSDGYVSPATLAWDGHNIESVTKVGIGRFELTLPAEWRNGNNYSVMVTGTSNLYLSGLESGPSNPNLQALNDGVTAAELDGVLTRRRAFEVEYLGTDGNSLTSPGQVIGIPSNPGGGDTYASDTGALSTHHVRVANDQVIQVETRTPISDWQQAGSNGEVSRNPSYTALIDEDEVYIVVIGSVDPTKFRG